MIQTIKRPILYPLIFSVAVLLIGYLYISLQDKKIAVVDAVKLFNNYHMKTDLEMQAKGQLDFLLTRTDSLNKQLQGQTYLKNEETRRQLLSEYNAARDQLDKSYAESNRVINEMVWKRLNPLIDEYGKKKKLRLIIGANGMGSVLYSDGYYDLTAELINYANEQYENGK